MASRASPRLYTAPCRSTLRMANQPEPSTANVATTTPTSMVTTASHFSRLRLVARRTAARRSRRRGSIRAAVVACLERHHRPGGWVAVVDEHPRACGRLTRRGRGEVTLEVDRVGKIVGGDDGDRAPAGGRRRALGGAVPLRPVAQGARAGPDRRGRCGCPRPGRCLRRSATRPCAPPWPPCAPVWPAPWRGAPRAWPPVWPPCASPAATGASSASWPRAPACRGRRRPTGSPQEDPSARPGRWRRARRRSSPWSTSWGRRPASPVLRASDRSLASAPAPASPAATGASGSVPSTRRRGSVVGSSAPKTASSSSSTAAEGDSSASPVGTAGGAPNAGSPLTPAGGVGAGGAAAESSRLRRRIMRCGPSGTPPGGPRCAGRSPWRRRRGSGPPRSPPGRRRPNPGRNPG